MKFWTKRTPWYVLLATSRSTLFSVLFTSRQVMLIKWLLHCKWWQICVPCVLCDTWAGCAWLNARREFDASGFCLSFRFCVILNRPRETAVRRYYTSSCWTLWEKNLWTYALRVYVCVCVCVCACLCSYEIADLFKASHCRQIFHSSVFEFVIKSNCITIPLAQFSTLKAMGCGAQKDCHWIQICNLLLITDHWLINQCKLHTCMCALVTDARVQSAFVCPQNAC